MIIYLLSLPELKIIFQGRTIQIMDKINASRETSAEKRNPHSVVKGVKIGKAKEIRQ